jgi:hypothetical protein
MAKHFRDRAVAGSAFASPLLANERTVSFKQPSSQLRCPMGRRAQPRFAARSARQLTTRLRRSSAFHRPSGSKQPLNSYKSLHRKRPKPEPLNGEFPMGSPTPTHGRSFAAASQHHPLQVRATDRRHLPPHWCGLENEVPPSQVVLHKARSLAWGSSAIRDGTSNTSVSRLAVP